MSATLPGLISVVVVAYGSTPLLRKCVDSLFDSEDVEVEVIVVDNGSTDGSVESLPPHHGLKVLRPGENCGFGAGCNLGARAAGGTFVVFVNPDAIVFGPTLKRLVAPLADDITGITTARVRLLAHPDLLNCAGLGVHFLGFAWARSLGQPVENVQETKPVAAASGSAMAMRADFFQEIGGFTEQLFLYHEDVELSLRAWMAGRQVLVVADANTLHDYSFSRNPAKRYYLERNRLCVVLSCYERRTLVVLLPALLAAEFGVATVALFQGWIGDKARGWLWLGRHYSWLRTHRREVQASRRVPDASLAHLLAATFEATQVRVPRLARPMDRLLARYWRLATKRGFQRKAPTQTSALTPAAWPPPPQGPAPPPEGQHAGPAGGFGGSPGSK